MRNGISGEPLPSTFPYADTINALCVELNCSPALVGAMKMNETGLGYGPATENDISGDGGHGIMQLTSSYPSDWAIPESNFRWAINQFIRKAWQVWTIGVPDLNDGRGFGLEGEELIRAISASYNEGLGTAIEGHNLYGNVDEWDTDNYGARTLTHYTAILDGTWNS